MGFHRIGIEPVVIHELFDGADFPNIFLVIGSLAGNQLLLGDEGETGPHVARDEIIGKVCGDHLWTHPADWTFGQDNARPILPVAFAAFPTSLPEAQNHRARFRNWKP